MSKFKEGDIVWCSYKPYEGEYIYLGVSYMDSEMALVKDKNGVECQFDYSDLKLMEDSEVKQEEAKHTGGSVSALDKQVSGSHYKDCGIQPIEYIHANGLDYFEGNAVKYITRHRKKNGKADIEKAIHYLELLLELEYKDK